MNIIRLATTLLLLNSVHTYAASLEDLYGTWRLVSFIEQNPATGQKIRDAYAPNPRGFLTYGRDGRMWAMIVTSDRPKRSEVNGISDEDRIELFKTVIAYSGTYTFDGQKATHNVDISWNETWTGTAQIRNLKLEGNRVTITTDPLRSVVDPSGQMGVFVLVWEKMR